jgi:hypothetical protein
VVNQPLPAQVDGFLKTSFGKVFVILLCLVLFLMSNPVLGVLGLLVAFDLLAKSSSNNTYYDVAQSDNNTVVQMEQINENIKQMQNQSLEHDVIQQMAPIPFSTTPVPKVYPLMDNAYDATPLTT